MFTYNFKYELKLLLRSSWIQLLTLLLLLLFVFASYNGKQKVDKRTADITSAQTVVDTSDKETLSILLAIEKGEDLNLSPWVTPTSPINIGNQNPRVAAMPANEMAFMSVGQSDIYTHYVLPKVSGDDFALNLSEMASPIQLLFGSFDLAFVVVYLLPLIVIAFSYNVLSEERERGSLKLLASQPISIRKWVFQKIGIRMFWISIMVLLATTVAFLLNDIKSFDGYVLFFVTCVIYMLFWFGLTFAVNIQIGKSTQNAFVLLGFWIVFVLLIPSIINQVSDVLYPVPSRNQLINEMREHKSEAEKKQDQILDNFLRDHPEYAVNNDANSKSFWHSYMASQKIVKEELQPLLSEFDNNLAKRQKWVNKLQWLSPAILVQQDLNTRAGTSKADYENYRQQILNFSNEWRDYFMPLLYNNQVFTSEHFSKLPIFQYKSDKSIINGYRLWGVLLLTSIVLVIVIITYKLRTKKEYSIIQ
ncbi:DUF3526 domain-containing protein [Aquimarina muelleri]|uniref:ABC-2 type transport system permease protein n=1 Tax=Aquimarina muelleri TaxID=279356 RepID=A0A918N5W6_9FLAO|nr:DUF3526 domain-containing protein [Aquimarina muelleri]MCX2764783.1 DUF3526 domain-containing protein [Aquimarina muelleri]GGX34009.1 hypothetical protein GCM10007384_38390 [Aquimarina muelleri]